VSAPDPADRPNVLLLIQDQLRYDVFHDQELCHTPTLDRLRADGITFERHHTTAGICSPARGSLFTGLYPHRHGILNNVHGTDALARDLSRQEATLGEILRDAGYRTGYVGKWHLGTREGPGDRGFVDNRASDEYLERGERFRPYRDLFGAPTTQAVFTRYRPPGPDVADRWPRRPFPLYSVGPVTEEVLPATAVTEEATTLLREYGRTGEPFFLVVSFVEPHWPSALPEPFVSMYDPASIPPWPNFDDPFVDKPATNRAGPDHFGVADFTWEDWQPVVARYLGAVSFVDELGGRLLATLEDAGLADRTVVMATADHGDMTGSHRQFNKGPLMYEEVYRIPLVLRGPGVPAGASCDRLTSHIDILPTILELANVQGTVEGHGRSLVPLLREGDPEWRDALMCEFHGDEFGLYSQRMVRAGPYKFVYNPNDVSELYDLDADPGELHNLAVDPQRADVRRTLEVRLLEAMYETEDPLREWAVNMLG
jgi:arylsulfatase A-like enzyme